MRTIDTRTDDWRAALNALRDTLGVDGDVVSEAGRAKTIELFGEPLSPKLVVDRICDDVRRDGIDAVLDYTRRLDGKDLTPQTVRVSEEEFAEAEAAADPAFLEAIRRAAENVREFQTAIRHRDVPVRRDTPGGGSVHLVQRYVPMKRVGLCVPGGAAAYPSTLLMTAVPAQVAGVPEIAVSVPPTAFGGYNADLLATCKAIGVTEVYRTGGAQGVAALAYGAGEGMKPVDFICGPGNLFVALAKRRAFGTVGIDSIAGPSEVIVLADETANPAFIAADLIAQAEHSPGSAVLVTWHEPLIAAVEEAIETQLATLSRADLIRPSLDAYGASMLARDEAEACELTDELATEHLHIQTSDPERLAEKITNAGAIFLGHHTPVALGDYYAGPSHVLPTGGTARFANGLCVNDFLKRSSVIRYDEAALGDAADDVVRLAEKEALTAHAASVSIRTA
ncbi:histidinol dehydrogenase [Alienimonas chondri]|uniref:Histidinol dehydrogenase n=1 Tax=Alienimonas chondri TaxID=2681879 RepID=A0ABX1V8P3_9PLAN|nr:histidinol dehydrogenase [Alienimonas chondri]NNJ24492.1 Histidinol dehydrogenase [Alienimonas chondri]